MIIGAEIALLIMGLIALIKGKLTLGKERILWGTPARLMGLICILPMPVTFCLGMAYGIIKAVQGEPIDVEAMQLPFALLEFGVLVLAIVLIYVIGVPLQKRQAQREADQENEAYQNSYVDVEVEDDGPIPLPDDDEWENGKNPYRSPNQRHR